MRRRSRSTGCMEQLLAARMDGVHPLGVVGDVRGLAEAAQLNLSAQFARQGMRIWPRLF